MAVADRTNPTPSTWPSGRIHTGDYADETAAEVEALWGRVLNELQSVAGTNAITASCTPTLTAYDKTLYLLKPANANSGAVTLNINSLGNKSVVNQDGTALQGGFLSTSSTYLLYYDGTVFRVCFKIAAAVTTPIPNNYCSFELGTNSVDPTNDIDISAGACKDSTNVFDMAMQTALVKRTDAAWVVGTNQGGMLMSANLAGTITVTTNTNVTGSGTAFLTDFAVGDPITTAGGQTRIVATISSNTAMTITGGNWAAETGVTYRRGGKWINTCYQVYALRNSSTGTMDIGFSTRLVTPVDIPSGYSAFRRIGMFLTDAANSNRAFDQSGDFFQLRTPFTAHNTGNITGTSAGPTSINLVLPNCRVVCSVTVNRTGGGSGTPTDGHYTANATLTPVGHTASQKQGRWFGTIIASVLSGSYAEQSIPGHYDFGIPTTATSSATLNYSRSTFGSSVPFQVVVDIYGWYDSRGM